MRHHKYNPEFKFTVDPIEFDKYTDTQVLRYCLGATMYMPGTTKFAPKILSKSIPGLTSMVLCFEDACPEEDVSAAEENTLEILSTLHESIENGTITRNDLPMIFIRVRSPEQFIAFSNRLTKSQAKILTGFNLPKFNSENGEIYLKQLVNLNIRLDEILYGMPIIEDTKVAQKESRIEELICIEKTLDKYFKYILQVRVGATDFSSIFGLRRSVKFPIYDILTVNDILADILNIFSRDNKYVISGPVWEYFRKPDITHTVHSENFDFFQNLINRVPVINNEIDGLLREVLIDRENGFCGRTIIHPTQIKYVNALMTVTKEEFNDAQQILSTADGVVKSSTSNKMNEIKPHTLWAQKILDRARAFGVVENENSIYELISTANEDF